MARARRSLSSAVRRKSALSVAATCADSADWKHDEDGMGVEGRECEAGMLGERMSRASRLRSNLYCMM